MTADNILINQNIYLQHTGIWYIFVDIALGASKNKNFIQFQESRHTAITSFDNNVAHSYKNVSAEIM